MNRPVKAKPLASPLSEDKLHPLIQTALKEDIGNGDVTTESIVSKNSQCNAVWRAKQDGVIAGLFAGGKVFNSLDKNIKWEPQVEEGQYVKSGDVLVTFEGSTHALLTGERTALNFVQRLCGIATKTAEFVKRLEGTNTQILDTRKTLPGFRVLDKYAVKTGGGKNHRMGLFDMALIKENHITAAGNIANAVEAVRASNASVEIEVETTTLYEVQEALNAGAEMIMLDNMSNEEMKQAVSLINGNAKIEASGNITIDRLKEVAECGVDYISVGSLTHSIKTFDISQIIKS